MRGLAPHLLTTLAVAALLAGPARGEDATLPLDLARVLPGPGGALLMLEPGGGTLPVAAPRFSLALVGAHAPLRYAEDDETLHAVDDAVGLVVGAAIGLGVGDVGVVLPVHLALIGTRDGSPWEASALGDLVVVPRMAIPLGRGSPVDLVLSVPVSLPAGDAEAFAGRSGASLEPRLRIGVRNGRIGVALRPGVLLQGGSELLSPALGNALTVRAAAGVGLGPTRVLQPELGVDAVVPFDQPGATSAELLAGLTVHPGAGLAVSVHGGFGLGWLPGVPAARLVVGVAWEGAGSPRRTDLEGDGVGGRRDRCPIQAEDRDGWQDRDGCPDLDDDRDGIPDAVDLCPRRAGAGPDGCPQ